MFVAGVVLVDALHRADVDARAVLDVDARLGDDRHAWHRRAPQSVGFGLGFGASLGDRGGAQGAADDARAVSVSLLLFARE